MVTLTDILKEIDRGCMAHNMVEDKFSYRIVYFVNDGNRGKKFRVDTEYDGLRQSLENMIRKNLSLSNTIVLAAVTVRKDGKTVHLLSRSCKFDLREYFRWITGEKQKYTGSNRYGNAIYGRQVAAWG